MRIISSPAPTLVANCRANRRVDNESQVRRIRLITSFGDFFAINSIRVAGTG
jgi:hypothetical protein